MSEQRFCTQCGKPLKEGARFCSFCGHDTQEDGEQEVPATPSQEESAAPAEGSEMPEQTAVFAAGPADAAADAGFSPDSVSGNTEAFSPADIAAADTPEPEERKPHKKHKAVVAVSIAAAVLAVSAGGHFGWKAYQDHLAAEAQQAYDDAHAAVAVNLNIVAPNYTDKATRIPLHVTGTDLDGNSVDTVAYIDGQNGLSLEQGTYEVVPVASPILEDGTIYTCPTEPASLTVGSGASSWDASTNSTSSGTANQSSASSSSENGSSSSSADASSDGSSSEATITFEVPNASEVTDQMIADAKQAAAQDPEDNGKAETLSAAATKKRDDAVAAEKAAAEKAAAEKAAAEKKAWYQKYASVIQSQQTDINQYNEENKQNHASEAIEWALWDADGDGTPELITHCTGGSMDGDDNINCIAGISNGTPKELIKFCYNMRTWYYPSADGVLREYIPSNWAEGTENYYTVSSSGLDKFIIMSWNQKKGSDKEIEYWYANKNEGNGSKKVNESYLDSLKAKYPTKPLSEYEWTTNPLG